MTYIFKGAQVLSIVDPFDERAREGHGITKKVLRLAYDEVERLRAAGVLIEAPPQLLCPTEERLNWEGLWQHFWAKRGMSSVLQTLLNAANANVVFGIRCDRIGRGSESTESFAVVGSGLGGAGRWTRPKRNENRAGAEAAAPEEKKEPPSSPSTFGEVRGVFDAVVVCTPAPNALQIEGNVSVIERGQAKNSHDI